MDAIATGVGTAGQDQMPLLLLGTLIRTLDGVLPVEFLEPGDRIVCRSGARKLVAVTARRMEGCDLVRIRRASLGHDRPDRDLLVTPDQPVLIRGLRASLLVGQPLAEIAAGRLVDGEFVTRETLQLAQGFALHFALDEVIYAEGLELACPALTPALTCP